MSKFKVIVEVRTQDALTPAQDINLRADLRKAIEETAFDALDAFLADQNLTKPYTVGVKDQ